MGHPIGEITMKYVMSNLEFAAPGEVSFKVENITVEYDLAELAQFAQNTKLILDTFKDVAKELVPLVSAEVEKNQKLRHSYRIEQMEKEAEFSN